MLLVAGYYDLIVPYQTPLKALSGAGFEPGRFEAHVYPVGHGVYEDVPTRPKSTDDLRAFYRKTV